MEIKVKTKLFFSVLLAVFFTSVSFSQISAKVGAGAGYLMPSGDYGGTIQEFYTGTKYGMSSGYNFHLKAKVSILTFAAKAEIDYATFSNKEEWEPGKEEEVNHNILSFRVGPEFRFDIPLSPITPYVDAYVSLNTITGSFQFKSRPDGLPSDKRDIESATRIGVGFGGGAELSIGPMMFLDLGIHYNMVNLLGKEFKATTNPNRIDSYTSLNDEKDPLYALNNDEHIISEARAINNLQFTLTVLFGF
jgi:opacity protein-like surface antigen